MSAKSFLTAYFTIYYLLAFSAILMGLIGVRLPKKDKEEVCVLGRVESNVHIGPAFYLLVLGSVHIFLCTAVLSALWGYMFKKDGYCFGLYIIYQGFTCSFDTFWSITGGIMLYGGNLDCIMAGSPFVVYALIMWFIQAFHFIMPIIMVVKFS